MKVRKPNFLFNANTPAHWLGGSPLKSHLCNSFTLLFPAGEKFFIKSVQKLFSEIHNENLKTEAKLFIKQEAQHYLEHEKFFQILKVQGYDIDKILTIVEGVVTTISENLISQRTAMAITAGCEHITALLSEIAISDDFFREAPADLKALFEWHSLEELEHRSVAFDVFEETDGKYSSRVIGLLGAYIFFTALTTFITCSLMRQDKTLFRLKTVQEAIDIFFLDQKLFFKAAGIFGRYLLPNFHPSGNKQLESLITTVFSRYASYGVA